jgi:hypothetical protein
MVYTKISTGSTKSSVGDLFDNAGAKSISMWLKIPSAPASTYNTYFNASKFTWKIEQGTGMFFRQVDSGANDNLWTWFDAYNYTSPATYSYQDIKYLSDVGSGWSHWAFTYPTTGTAKIYIAGALIHTYASQTTVDTEINPTATSYFTLGGVANSVTPTFIRFAQASYSDVRLYDKELDATEVATIAAGDW